MITATKYDFLSDISTPGSATVRFIFPTLAAFVTHALVQRSEPYGHRAVGGQILLILIVSRLIHDYWSYTLLHSFTTSLQMFGVFWMVISTSMVIYRLFFHQMCKFPGPLWARISMWFWVPIEMRGQRHLVIPELHKKYGHVVRVGPNHLSIDDPDAIPLVHGMNTVKGPWYLAQALVPGVYSLQNEPTHASHSARRRLWDPAFTVKAVRGYEKLIFESRQDLMDHFDEAIESPKQQGRLDLRESMLFFGFDTMSKLGFGRCFDLLSKPDNRHLVEKVELVPRVITTIGNVPYIMSLMRYLGNPLREVRAWILAALDWRLARIGESEYDHADVFAYLTGEEVAKKGVKAIHDRETLFQDAQLLVVAGSDTTANTMTNMIFELARQPQLYKRLQEEMLSIFPEGTEPNDLDLIRDKAVLLKACIHESMRLWPVVPTGLTRTVIRPFNLPTGEYMHMGACVSLNAWTLHHDARNFARPNEFLPDRWLDENGELNIEAKRSGEAKVDGAAKLQSGGDTAPAPAKNKYEPHNTKAFIPFSVGPTSCVGKNVAWAELRAVMSSFLLKYDVEMTDKDYQMYNRGFEDHFVSANGPCWVTLKPRKQ